MKPNIQTKIFVAKGKAPAEAHVMIHANPGLSSVRQVGDIFSSLDHLSSQSLQGYVPVFMRFFLSDSFNLTSLLRSYPQTQSCAVSVIEQPPLDGSKIGLWVWFMKDVQVMPQGRIWTVRDGRYTHLFSASWTDDSGVTTSKAQMSHLFNRYADALRTLGASLSDNCMRTWLFVQNIDVNYAGVVRARNEVFLRHALTRDTHFIASTGIQGRTANYNKVVSMDAYAVLGIDRQQVRYLSAPDHLGSTADYGVAFERGTSVCYDDRQRVFISGTASIDPEGNILHLGDVRLQTLRAIDNVRALLADAQCDLSHVAQLIVYLRDLADYHVVSELCHEHFPDTPMILLLAPVCRPGWLVEMECIAVK